ncbi:GHKL domain-containing protein [Paenibacillus sp. sptzw28]|uniref:sensor histidine kinase n=1 Tax=Paenibacillus sp. sptzw28 TaxID=715179 RepID=UPI001C6EC9CA|nr:ATP-binding protein [Paenibacillus sp. sptzw28]QYR20405.1 GHKL domain-containing protein [Paenibacillus sp. sptzw28]
MPFTWDDVDRMVPGLIAITIPQCFLYLWLSFVWFGVKPERLYRRMLMFSLLCAFSTDLTFQTLPLWIHLINSQLSFLVWFKVFFKEIKIKLTLLIYAGFACTAFLHQFIVTLSVSKLGGYDAIVNGSFLTKIALVGPSFVIIGAVAWIMQKKQLHPAKKFRNLLLRIRYKAHYALVTLVIAEALLFVLIFFPLIFQSNRNTTELYPSVIAFVIFVIIIIIIIRLTARTRSEAIQATQDAYISDLLKMFASIRGQRHDFTNHVQVMYSMLTLKKYDELRAYMEDMVKEIQTMTEATDELPSPALAALVQAKAAIARNERIRFTYQIPNAPLTFTAVKNIDLVRMIGNLVDNAFDEVMKLPETEREVLLELYIEKEMLHIAVMNRGLLSAEEIRQIFEPGYTTKSGEHSGLGLANVLERASHYKGTVTVESDLERGVVFTIKMPFPKD